MIGVIIDGELVWLKSASVQEIKGRAGDRQLAQSDETMKAWMRAGIPFSNAPGVAYEYSNYGDRNPRHRYL